MDVLFVGKVSHHAVGGVSHAIWIVLLPHLSFLPGFFLMMALPRPLAGQTVHVFPADEDGRIHVAREQLVHVKHTGLI